MWIMDGLWIVLGIVLVIIVLIVLDKIINSGYKKELINKLEKEWGKENCEKYTEEEFEIIKYYYEHICKDLYETLSKYMELTEDDFQVEINRSQIVIKIAGEET